MINLVCTFDNNYSQHCGALLASLFENNKEQSFCVYILSDFINEDNRQGLKNLVDKYRNSVEFFKVDKNMFSGFPHGGDFPNISLAAYYRLLIPTILPTRVTKVLYMDCDIIVNGNIEELWGSNVENCAIAAVEDSMATVGSPERLGYSSIYQYFNSGVLLMNLQLLREMEFTKCAFAYLRANINRIVYHDQDVLNALLYNKKLLLPIKWNVMDCFMLRRPLMKDIYREQLSEVQRNPIVIHYTGRNKPWYKECQHPYAHLYYKYLRLTEWKDYKPKSQYTTKKEILIYKTKCIGKRLMDYLHLKSFIYLKTFNNTSKN